MKSFIKITFTSIVPILFTTVLMMQDTYAYIAFRSDISSSDGSNIAASIPTRSMYHASTGDASPVEEETYAPNHKPRKASVPNENVSNAFTKFVNGKKSIEIGISNDSHQLGVEFKLNSNLLTSLAGMTKLFQEDSGAINSALERNFNSISIVGSKILLGRESIIKVHGFVNANFAPIIHVSSDTLKTITGGLKVSINLSLFSIECRPQVSYDHNKLREEKISFAFPVIVSAKFF